MLVHEIINTDIAPLKSSDSVNLAITKMDLMHTTKFGVVNEERRLIGMLSLDNLVDVNDVNIPVSEVPLDDPIYVPGHQHLFEAARLMLAHELYVLPAVDDEFTFIGMVKKRDVLKALGEVFNLSSYGSVITIELEKADFTLTEMVRIIETEGAKILGMAVQQPDREYPYFRVSVKLNLEDSSVVSSALRRFGYHITSEANSESLEANISDRADELMRYLDI